MPKIFLIMYLTKEQFEKYTDQGFVLLTECFSKTEVNRLKVELPIFFRKERLGRIFEEESNIVRAVHGSHKTNEVFQRLSRNPRLVESPMQLFGSKAYI